MYNRYIPNGAVYTRILAEDGPPPVQRAGEGGPLEVVPVDNLAEALQVLGLRPEQGPHAHSSKRPPREVPF